MAKRLPPRFVKAEPDAACDKCDKVRSLCRDCEKCQEHCECPETCETCGGLYGPTALDVAKVRGVDACWCLECVVCHAKVHRDHADYGYGLTEEQTQENFGTACTAVCETCVDRRRTSPAAVERGFSEAAPREKIAGGVEGDPL
jgi:hypothetical protein